MSYQKRCNISPRNVRLTDTKQALLPVHVMTLRLAKSTYPCKIIGGEGRIMIDASLGTCAICGKTVRSRPALCNSCGSVYHPRRLFRGHGHRCKNCGKTICDKCTHWITRAVLFKKAVCRDCAAPRSPARATVGGAREERLGGDGVIAGTPDISINAEWNGGDEWRNGQRRAARRQQRTTPRTPKSARIAAGIAVAASIIVLALVLWRKYSHPTKRMHYR